MGCDWKELYGELPDGYHSIVKKIKDFRDIDDYDGKTYYANFEVRD